MPPIRTAVRQACHRLLIVLSFCFLACSGNTEGRPNILLIIGDDNGYPYFGFMGHPIVKTPHLDQLANEGIVFTHGYDTSSTCRPSLMTLVTGLHPDQWDAELARLSAEGRKREGSAEILDFDTLPEALGERGYVSFQGGKYWEGSYLDGGFTSGTKAPANPDAAPRAPASSSALVHLAAGGEGLSLGRETLQPLWDFFDGLDGSRPFFVWYAPLLPHGPFDPPPRFTRPYQRKRLTRQAIDYYGNITRFDAGVGEIMQQLRERGLSENTLVIYLSDNGWQQPPNQKTAFNGGDRGKNSIYDLGFRTPIIFHWPAELEQGRRRSELVSTVDVVATILDYAGAEALPGRDGISLRPALEEGQQHPRQNIIASMKRLRSEPKGARDNVANWSTDETAYFLRNATWRYIWYVDRDREELYAIGTDPTEELDVAAENPQLTKRFREQIMDWRERMNAPFH